MRYLFCSLDSPGFLFPALGIARELRARSHEVAFVTGPSFQGAVREAGFERIPRGERDGKSFQIQVFSDPLEMVRQVKHIEYALQRFAADVLVGQQMTMGPLLVAEQRHIPVASLGMITYLYPPAELPPPGERTPLQRHSAYMHDSLLTKYNVAREIFGLPVFPTGRYGETPLLGDMLLLRTVSALEGDVGALPRSVHLVGDCLWDPPAAPENRELAAWLEAGPDWPIVFVQFSKHYFYRDPWPLFVDVLREHPLRVAAAVSWVDADKVAVPDQFFVRRFLLQRQVLPLAHAVIANATTTVVLGSLVQGLPSLLLAAGTEQVATAARCGRAGVAVELPIRSADVMTPENLARAVERLLGDAELRRGAKHMQAEFARVNGHVRAADLLEELGRRRRPVTRDEFMPATPP